MWVNPKNHQELAQYPQSKKKKKKKDWFLQTEQYKVHRKE